jgi:SpoVK/Ycf46/Vps4 family AAA+-type ATPase
MKNREKFWVTPDNKRFYPEDAHILDKIEPGIYDIGFDNRLYLDKLSFTTTDLLNLPDSNTDKVLVDIDNFWKKEKLFKEYSFPYKRGILLYGPAGCGKSSTIALVSKKVIENKGIVLFFKRIGLFSGMLQVIRNYYPTMPIVAIMEDLDQLLYENNVSEVLNLLDGIENTSHNVVYLATTNRIEALQQNIKNRPSRFDKKILFDFPNLESRKLYLKHISDLNKSKRKKKIDLDLWAKQSEGFSFAHLKELFISVILFGNNFKDVIKELTTMSSDELSINVDSSDNYEYDDMEANLNDTLDEASY